MIVKRRLLRIPRNYVREPQDVPRTVPKPPRERLRTTDSEHARERIKQALERIKIKTP